MITYRKALIGGAASASLALFAGGALAQIGQQQQQRPGQVSPVNGKDFLKDLEGSWNVEVSIYDLNALMGEDGQRRTPGQPGIGDRPGVGTGVGLQQFQVQLEQLLIRHGVDSEDAREKAREFVNDVRGEDYDIEELRERLKDALEDADVSEVTARMEAQRLAPQLHRHLTAPGQRPGQAGQQPGQRPGPGQQPGQTGQQPGQRPGQIGQQPGQVGVGEREAQHRAEGTATRSWILNDSFLQEELTFTINGNNNANNNANTQDRNAWNLRGDDKDRINLRDGDEFEGMALLAFEPANGDLCIVWADNTKSMLHYGIGRYDSAEQQMVFHTIDPDRVQLPGTQTRPGISPAPRPTPGGPQHAPGQRPGQHDRPGQPGQPGQPGIGQQDRPDTAQDQQQMRLDRDGARIVLRVIDDNEHVVTVYRNNGIGQATRVMEITYKRDNGKNNND